MMLNIRGMSTVSSLHCSVQLLHLSPETICSSSGRTRQPRKREDTVCSGESRWELPTRKRRGGSGGRGSVALTPRVNSGTDPALYAVRKISGRPCVPGRLWKNRAPADHLRRGFFGSVSSSSAGGRLFQHFPPTQGLPEILRSNGTDRSEADAPREGKGTTRPSPEPPLLLVLLGVAPSPGPNRDLSLQ